MRVGNILLKIGLILTALTLLFPVSSSYALWLGQGRLTGYAGGHTINLKIWYWDGYYFIGMLAIREPNQRFPSLYIVYGTLTSNGYLTFTVNGHNVKFIPQYVFIYDDVLRAWGILKINGAIGSGNLILYL